MAAKSLAKLLGGEPLWNIRRMPAVGVTNLLSVVEALELPLQDQPTVTDPLRALFPRDAQMRGLLRRWISQHRTDPRRDLARKLWRYANTG